MKNSFLPKGIFTLAVMIIMTFGTMSGQTWNLVDIDELTSTDVFVILDTTSGRAMTNSNGTSSAPAAYLLTLSDDKTEITSEVPDNCKWNISGDAENGYTFYPNGSTSTWLYSTNTNNGMRVGTNTNKYFIITNDFLQNTSNNRYVGVYNNQDWRCYTTINNNIINTRTKFFRYTESASAVARPTFSLASGTYYTSQTVTITHEDPDAVIHYTLDGTQPDENSPEYAEPLTLSENTTLKAIAILNDESSSVATANYVFIFPIEVSDLATLRQGETDGTVYRYTGNATVTFANSNRNVKYIQDATAAILIDDNSGIITSTYVQGDVMTGVIGTLQVYQDMLQFVPATDPGEPVASGSIIEPVALTCDELLANAEDYEAELVTLTNAVIDASSTTFTASTYYDLNGNSNPKMGVRYSDLDLVGETIPTVAQNITGVVFDYRGTYEVFPRSMADLSDYADTITPDPPVAPDTFFVAFNVDGIVDYVDTITYIEGEEPVYLPYIPNCKDNTFAGWTSEQIEGEISDLNGIELLNDEFTPTSDTMLYAVFAYGMDEASNAIYITRDNFNDTVTPYGTDDAWSATDAYGQNVIQGFCDLYTNSNSMQMNASRTGLYNTTAIPGAITYIVIEAAENSSTREWTPYVANEPLTAENYQTAGTPLSAQSIAAYEAGQWTLSSDYQYFYLTFNTGAAYVSAVEISYFNADMVTYRTHLEPDTTVIEDVACEGSGYYDWGFSIDEPVTGTYFTSDNEEIPYCYEVTRLELTVSQPDTIHIYKESCSSYVLDTVWPEITYYASTVDTISIADPDHYYGCPTTAIYHITINEPVEMVIIIDTCDSYTWGDDTYYESGRYVKEFQTTAGCDSIVTLNLTISTGFNSITEETVCGDSYTWTYGGNTEILTASGTYERTVSGDHACADTYTLELTLNVPDTTDIYAQICDGETYSQNGFNETEAGDYELTLTDMHNCDSIVRLHLTVGDAAQTELTDITCQNTHYTENGFDIYADNTGTFEHSITIERPGTCDSIVHLVLTVLPSYSMEISEEACGEYTWNGNVYTESGEYTLNGQTNDGCDSIVTLYLTIHQPATTTLTERACSQYEWNNNIYTESGEYTWTGQTTNGCDSVVTLQLTIDIPDTTDFTATSVDNYLWDGTIHTESGDYTRTFTNMHNCDSVVTLHLTITHNYTVTFDINGNTQLVGPYTVNSSDEPTQLPTLEGCGNMAFIGWTTENALPSMSTPPTIITDITPTSDVTLYAVFAQTPELDSITITRNSFATVAAYGTIDTWQAISATGTTITGEADLYTNTSCMQMRSSSAPHPYNLTELPGNITSISIVGAGSGSVRPWTPYLSNTPLTVDNFSAEGTSLTTLTPETNSSEISWNVTTPARYFYLSLGGGATYVNAITVTYATSEIQYTFNPTEEVVLNESICEGGTYSDNNFNESTAGTYETTLYEGDFCATHIVLNLTVNQPVENEITETACGSYVWDNEALTTSGDYTATFTAANGCDSTVTLHLTINQPVESEITESACESYVWNNETLTASGDYTATFTAANGCDSTVTLHLTINQPVENEITESACESYVWNNETLTTSGDYTATFTAANGCDSTVTLHLTINQPVESEITESACESYVWNNETLTTSGDYTATFTAANGCDSTVTLHLTISQPVESEITETACESYVWNNETLTTSGDYTAIFTAANGCDSTVTLHLTINQPVESEITETACESYVWNNETLTTSGDYTAIFTAANGCDSTVTLHLTINLPVESEITETACDSYVWNDETLTTSGDYTAIFTAANGCDSTVTLHLTINQSVEEEVTISAEESYEWNDSIYTESGDYTWVGQTAEGCDSTVTLHLTITVGISENGEGLFSCFPNPTTGWCTFKAPATVLMPSRSELRIYDSYGKLVLVKEVVTETTRFDMGACAPGVYILRWISDGEVKGTTKLLLTR